MYPVITYVSLPMLLNWIQKCIDLIIPIVLILLYICTYHITCTYVSIYLACKYVETDLQVHMLNNSVTRLYKL